MKRLLIALLVLSDLYSMGQVTDFTHLNLDLQLDTVKAEVIGTVALSFDYQSDDSKRDSVYLNGIKMYYRMVMLNGEKVNYEYDDKGIWLLPEDGLLKAKDNSLVIHYNCKPRRGIFFVGWEDQSGRSRRQIWTQGQGIDHRHWIPYKDDQTDKLVTEISLSFDSTYQVISNGQLAMRSPNQYKPGEMVWRYRMKDPHPGYLMMLAVGKYDARQTSSRSGVPLTQYYYPDREADYPWYYYKNEEIFNFLEKEVGVSYPWQNYKQVPVQNFQHGAMENTTATIFGDFFLVDEHSFNDQNYTYVNAHELAHQWFGNLVTAEGSDHHWLHEGFATYYQWLSERHLYGQDFFDWERHKASQLVFGASAVDSIPLGNGKAGSSRFYQKGAWVLYMLNDKLSTEVFREAIQHYLKENRFGVVRTEDLNNAIADVCNEDCSNFFDSWVATAGEPRLSIKGSLEAEGLNLIVDPQFYPFGSKVEELPVDLYFKDGKSRRYYFPLSDSLELHLIDSMDYSIEELITWVMNPNMSILAEIVENKPFEAWEAQYKLSKHLLDRYAAIKALRDFKLKDKDALLIEVFEREEEFFTVRAEALEQLLRAGHKKSSEFLLQALKSPDVQLQKEAVRLIQDSSPEITEQLKVLRGGDSYQLRVNAIHKSINVDNPEDNQWLLDSVLYEQPGIPGHSVAITALLYRLALLRDREALNQLKDYVSAAYDFRTRMKAIESLGALGYFDKGLCSEYFDALFNSNRSLSRTSRAQLKKYYKEEQYKKWIDDYIEWHQGDWTDFQKRLVNLTFGLNLD